MERLEDTILRNLLYNDDFVRKSLPYLKNDYFLEHTDKILFEEINKFMQKYNVSPTKESLVIELNENSKLQEDQFKGLIERLNDYETNKNEQSEIEWLIDTTEQFCQDKAIYNAVLESI